MSKMHVTLRVALLGGAALALLGCQDIREAAGVVKTPPDEFAVVTKAPLVIPPDYNLRPPKPGAPPTNQSSPTDSAEAALTGDDPATVAASALDAVAYTVTDQHNDAVASGSATVQLDAGPTITSVTPAVVEMGQSTEIGTVAPGLAGDMLTLTKTSGDGALSLQLVGGVEEVIYTAPAAVAACAWPASSAFMASSIRRLRSS